MAIEAETPATRTRPEAELVAEAGGSDGCPVRLSVANVFNNRTQEVTIHSTSTIGDLKAMIQKVFDNKPASQQQRLIFRGKHCEDTQQLGHILRGVSTCVFRKVKVLRVGTATLFSYPCGRYFRVNTVLQSTHS